jgi:mono/diheme cytochrome c family protein
MKSSRFKLVLLLVLAGLTISGAGIYVLVRGVSARAEPSAAEEFIARRLRHFAIPRHARNLENPIELNAEVLQAAKVHFAEHCASCHGNDGRGETSIGRGLYPKAPDMTLAETQDLADGELYYIIENGIRFTGMPAFSEEPDNEQNKESWDLVHFIRHLPKMSDDEIAAMKKLNPKSSAELEREEKMRRFLAGEDTEAAEASPEHSH